MRGIRREAGPRQPGTGTGRAGIALLVLLAVALGFAALGTVLVGRRTVDRAGAPGRAAAEAPEVRWRRAARHHLDESGNLDLAIAALESLTAARPSDPEALTWLGEALSSAPRDWARAIDLFERAIAIDSGSADAHRGLVEARVRSGDVPGARASLARFARLRPDHPFPRILAFRLAYLEGDRNAARRELASLESAFPEDLTVRAWSAEERARLALVDGDREAADREYSAALEAARTRGDGAEILERTVDRAWALAWWGPDTARAIALVDSAVAAWPAGSVPMADWPFHYLAEFYAMAGRPGTATGILETHAGHMRPPPDAVPNPWWQAAWGLIALAEDRPPEAVERFALWDAGIGCEVCALGDLARALEAEGRVDSALVVWRRYLAATDLQRIEWDPYYLAMAEKRVGEVDSGRRP